MALSDHLRELRARILKIVTIVFIGMVVALFFFDPIFALVLRPYENAVAQLPDDIDSIATIGGVGGPLMLYLKLCGTTSIILTSPLWLYQIWAFILPGLHDKERKWTRVFAAVAGPLFLAGVAVGYFTLPKGLELLIGLTQEDLTNLVEFGDYLSFLIRTLLVFGIAFEIPVFVVLLNLAGVLPGKALGAHRAWVVVGTFIFAAIATPSTDPFTMLFLAIPMVMLFLISEAIARFLDRRRAAAEDEREWDDDQASPL
ncbi:twin-arginine translocase subunit TatC [Nocardioides sp.]|uniref:twin-arginine translocase subunit TatC n=1 Tax=Nocardioides sp. TaxID=35761 RepID=UPI002ED3C998